MRRQCCSWERLSAPSLRVHFTLKPDFADLGYSNIRGLTVQHMRSQENLGHLRVVRPKGDYAGSLRKVQVTLDGEKLAALLPGEVFEADI